MKLDITLSSSTLVVFCGVFSELASSFLAMSQIIDLGTPESSPLSLSDRFILLFQPNDGFLHFYLQLWTSLRVPVNSYQMKVHHMEATPDLLSSWFLMEQ